jgi:hypothetical protein
MLILLRDIEAVLPREAVERRAGSDFSHLQPPQRAVEEGKADWQLVKEYGDHCALSQRAMTYRLNAILLSRNFRQE